MFRIMLFWFVETNKDDRAYLDESNVGGLLTEALTADVQAIFADQTGFVCADAAVKQNVSRFET